MKKKYLSLFICTIILISSVGFNYAPTTYSANNALVGIWDLKDTSKIMADTKSDRMYMFYPNMTFILATDGAKKNKAFTGTYTFTKDKLTLKYKDGTKAVTRTMSYDLPNPKTLRYISGTGTKLTYVVYNKFVK